MCPADSRAGHDPRFLKPSNITAEKLAVIRKLDDLAKGRGQSLAQMSLAWVLRQPAVTSALIGEKFRAVSGPGHESQKQSDRDDKRHIRLNRSKRNPRGINDRIPGAFLGRL